MNIHFVGCHGVSMQVLSCIMQSYGHNVTGSDITLNGHDETNIDGADLVVYTAAVGEDNIELVAARKKGIRVIERAEFLGLVASNYKYIIAVAGSHGKTTATGFLREIFMPLSPTVHIGGKLQNNTDTAGGGTEYFLTEACEYKRSFLHIKPHLAVILNIELDHTDYYKDIKDYSLAFSQFASGAKKSLVCGDKLMNPHFHADNAVTFGLGSNCFYRAANIKSEGGGHSFDILKDGRLFLKARIKIYGRHNILNALAAAAAADMSGVDKTLIANGLEKFSGVKRRFEQIQKTDKLTVFSDYAHHPSEIETTVATARTLTDKRVTIVFEPHTYSRTLSLQEEFVHSLSKADRIILVPIYAAREAPIQGVTSHNLVLPIQKAGKHALHMDTFSQVKKYLLSTAKDGDIVVFTGAGDIEKAAAMFAAKT